MSHRLNAEHLRQIAAKHGDFNDARIAKRSGVHRATLHRLANGRGEPTIGVLMMLANTYDIQVESLVRSADEAPALAA